MSDHPTAPRDDLPQDAPTDEPATDERLSDEPVAAPVPPGLLPGWEERPGGPVPSGSAPAARHERAGISLPTIIWGLLIGLAATAFLVDQTSGSRVDLGVAVPVALLGAGAALVVWGIAGLARRRP